MGLKQATQASIVQKYNYYEIYFVNEIFKSNFLNVDYLSKLFYVTITLLCFPKKITIIRVL